MEANVMQHIITTVPAEWLIASIWQGLVLTALAWALLRFATGLRASTRFTVWFITFLLVASLPVFAVVRGLIGKDVSTPAAPAMGFALQLGSGWAFTLEAFWMGASLFALARLTFSLIEMRKLVRTSQDIDKLPQELLEAVSRPGKRAVEVRLSNAVDSPSVVGFFRPAILVPRSIWNDLTSEDLKQVLLHEMAHLERGDDWTNLLQKLLRALSPLNPALIVAERQLCREREHACDDAVLDQAGNARAYATCLTKLAENKMVRRVSALAPGLWKRHSELASRVENILHRRSHHAPWVSKGLVAAGLIVTLSSAAVLQRFSNVVTFHRGVAQVAAARVPAAVTDLEKVSFQKARFTESSSQPAQFHEAVFHPDMSATGKRASLLPKHDPKRQLRTFRHLQLLQVSQDPESGGVTLILLTVEVPQTKRNLHGVSRSFISTTDHWIDFQI